MKNIALGIFLLAIGCDGNGPRDLSPENTSGTVYSRADGNFSDTISLSWDGTDCVITRRVTREDGTVARQFRSTECIHAIVRGGDMPVVVIRQRDRSRIYPNNAIFVTGFYSDTQLILFPDGPGGDRLVYLAKPNSELT